MTAVNTARAAFVTWDDNAQTTIVAEAPDKAQGQAALATHRDQRDRVLIAFEAAYRTLALAAADINAEKLAAALAAAAALSHVYQAVVGQAPAGLAQPAHVGGD